MDRYPLVFLIANVSLLALSKSIFFVLNYGVIRDGRRRVVKISVTVSMTKGLRSRVFFSLSTDMSSSFHETASLRCYCATRFCGRGLELVWRRTRGINISRSTLPSRWTLLYDCADVPRETLNGGSPRRRPEEYTSRCIVFYYGNA